MPRIYTAYTLVHACIRKAQNAFGGYSACRGPCAPPWHARPYLASQGAAQMLKRPHKSIASTAGTVALHPQLLRRRAPHHTSASMSSSLSTSVSSSPCRGLVETFRKKGSRVHLRRGGGACLAHARCRGPALARKPHPPSHRADSGGGACPAAVAAVSARWRSCSALPLTPSQRRTQTGAAGTWT